MNSRVHRFSTLILAVSLMASGCASIERYAVAKEDCYSGDGRYSYGSFMLPKVPLTPDEPITFQATVECEGIYQVFIGFNPPRPFEERVNEEGKIVRYEIPNEDNSPPSLRELTPILVTIYFHIKDVKTGRILDKTFKQIEWEPVMAAGIYVFDTSNLVRTGRVYSMAISVDAGSEFFSRYSTAGMSLRKASLAKH